MNKAFAHRSGQRQGDLYHTPKSLIWVAKDIIKREFKNCLRIFEPATGSGSIAEELKKMHFINIIENDIYYKNKTVFNMDYLKIDIKKAGKRLSNNIITNPPFSLWDEFVLKSKTHCKKFMYIGRLNYFGTQSRLLKGIWNNLKGIYPFSRYADYQTPYRDDGLFHVGTWATAWFLWDMEYAGKLEFEVLDVSKYAKLGSYLKTCNCGNKVKPDNKSEIWLCERCNCEVYRRVS